MLDRKIEELLTLYSDFLNFAKERMIGLDDIIRKLFIAFMIRGNILLEGPPGVGKTSMVKLFARFLGLHYSRIQFTPDLMPLDIIGSNILEEQQKGTRGFTFYKGPIFANIVLGDEINRATPKTQSAFLEAMEEKRITFLGEEHPLPDPFMVIATQNPIELEGTFPLPEAQIDRFYMKLYFSYPNFANLSKIITVNENAENLSGAKRTREIPDFHDIQELEKSVEVLDDIKGFISRIVVSSHPSYSEIAIVKRYVLYGASPRAGIYLLRGAKWKALLENRVNVSFRDVREIAFDILNHRIILSFDGEAEGIKIGTIVESLIDSAEKEYRVRGYDQH